MKKKWMFVLLVLTMMIGMSMKPASGKDITFAWTNPSTYEDGTPLTELGGVKAYCGPTSGGPYSPTFDHPTSAIGQQEQHTFQAQNEPGKTYYCVVTSYLPSGLESVYSDEVSYTFPQVAPAVPSSIVITIK